MDKEDEMISILKISGKPNTATIKEFLCDTESEVTQLPHIKSDGNGLSEWCSAGSTAICIDPLSVYILGNDDVWHKI